MKLTSVYPHSKARTESKVEVKKGNDTRAEGKSAEAAAPAGASDKVVLSSNSRDVGKIREIIESTPAVRAERIEEIKGQIERGEYQVDPNDVADKMLMSLLTDTMKE